jgi:hypothetical protein
VVGRVIGISVCLVVLGVVVYGVAIIAGALW